MNIHIHITVIWIIIVGWRTTSRSVKCPGTWLCLFWEAPNRWGTQSWAEKLPNFVMSSHMDPIGDQKMSSDWGWGTTSRSWRCMEVHARHYIRTYLLYACTYKCIYVSTKWMALHMHVLTNIYVRMIRSRAIFPARRRRRWRLVVLLTVTFTDVIIVTLMANPLPAVGTSLPSLPILLAVWFICASNVATGPKILQFPNPAALLATEGFIGGMFHIYRRHLTFEWQNHLVRHSRHRTWNSQCTRQVAWGMKDDVWCTNIVDSPSYRERERGRERLRNTHIYI